MRKYATWASLNEEGERQWGEIFHDGTVPIKSIIQIPAKLKGVNGTEYVTDMDGLKLFRKRK
ncbi:MAG: hypothetical protein NWF09_08375 [Candidatus Bathyarchaeota archaeon]|nr:hypothetical protein [Candidatus Bathyarchaeota archaeon]